MWNILQGFGYHQSLGEPFGSDLFCLLTGDFFFFFFSFSSLFPRAADGRRRNAAGGCDLTFSSEPRRSAEGARTAARGAVVSLCRQK